jgi:hypothetical protein
MGGRARSRSPREAKQFVGRLCQTPILSIKAVSQKGPTESFHRDRFLRVLYEFFEARVAPQRIPERMQAELAVA